VVYSNLPWIKAYPWP